MVDDPRYRTRDFLEGWTNPATALNNANLTKDDDSTPVSFITAFGSPDYPLTKVFLTKGVDLIFSVGDVTSTPLVGYDKKAYGYDESVPVTVSAIDKAGITGEKLRWKAEAELRRIVEEYPTGSERGLETSTPAEKKLGSTVLYQQTFTLNYRRDKS